MIYLYTFFYIFLNFLSDRSTLLLLFPEQVSSRQVLKFIVSNEEVTLTEFSNVLRPLAAARPTKYEDDEWLRQGMLTLILRSEMGLLLMNCYNPCFYILLFMKVLKRKNDGISKIKQKMMQNDGFGHVKAVINLLIMTVKLVINAQRQHKS